MSNNPNDEDWRGWKFSLDCDCSRCRPINDYIIEQIKIRTLSPKKEEQMNEITQTTVNPADVSPLVDLVEVLDAQGNPTGEYRPRTPTPEEATLYTTAEDGEHVVN